MARATLEHTRAPEASLRGLGTHIDDDLDAHLCADVYRLTSSVARAELFEDYEQALKWIMRREFLPHPPLLKQQNAAHDGRNHAPE